MLAAEARQVADAQVVGKYEYYVRALRRCLAVIAGFCPFWHRHSYEGSKSREVNVFSFHDSISPQPSFY